MGPFKHVFRDDNCIGGNWAHVDEVGFEDFSVQRNHLREEQAIRDFDSLCSDAT